MISLLSKGPSRVFSSTTLGKQRVYCFSINALCDLAYLHRCSCSGEGNGNSLQRSCLENPTDRGAWRATVHRVAESRTRVSDSHTQTHTHTRVQPKGSPGRGGFTLGAPLTCPGGLPDHLGTRRCSGTCQPQQLGSHRAPGTKASSAPTGVRPDSLGLSFGQSPLATRGIGSSPGQGWRKISPPAHLRPKKTHSETESSELAPSGPSQ